MLIRADLHIHTVLSPCAEVEMIPPLIVERALAEHLDLIAITDHNLCLFDTVRQLRALQAELELALPHLPNVPDKLGEQFIVDAAGDFVAREERLLLISADITLEGLVREVNALGGMAIPAHVDRMENGLIPLLGFVPQGLVVPALEISPNILSDVARAKFRLPEHLAVVRGSDAHWLDAIGSAVTELDFEGTRSVANVARALREKRYAIQN